MSEIIINKEQHECPPAVAAYIKELRKENARLEEGYQKLKPCPFCGSKARFTAHLEPETYKSVIAVICTNPDCLAQSGWSKVRAEVVRAWNKRAGESE